MSSRTIGAVLILVSAFAFLGKGGLLPAPAPRPVEPSVEIPKELQDSLRSAFSGRKAEAIVWAGLLQGLGRFIAADGKTQEPKLRTMSDIDALRVSAISAPVDAVAGGAEIGQVIGPYLAKLGESSEPLDGARRQQVSNLFIGAGQALNK